MREDDYTGNQIGDSDDPFLGADFTLTEIEPEWGDFDDDALFDDDNDEQFVNTCNIADGATSLYEAAAKLHDYADELMAMSDDGWEIVDDIRDGGGTAVRFTDEDD